MNGHPEYLELIAMSIDFDLTDEEFGRLSTHLARCPECRRAAEDLRGDATAIAAYPAPRLAPARSEQILRTALRTPRPQPRWGMLAIAAMLTTLGGGVLFAGFQLINDDDATPSEPPPSLVAEASAPPSPTPAEDTAEPGAPDGGNPPPIDIPEPTPEPPDVGVIDFEFPRPYTSDVASVRVAPAPADQLWVTFQQGRSTVLAHLDAAGNGSPWVEPYAEACEPFAVEDGSVRVLCLYGDYENEEECGDMCVTQSLYAWQANGDELPGFPLSLPNGISTAVHGGRMIGTDFVAVVTESYDEVVAEYGGNGSARLFTVAADGSVNEGANVTAPLMCCAFGPDGVAYGSTPFEEEGLEMQTQLVAFDQNGVRPGWPIVVEGNASGPSFGPNGQILYSSWIGEGSRIARLNPDGSPAGDPTDAGAMIEWDPHVDGPLAPLVDERSHASIMADGRIHRIDATGAPVPGFPYEPETSFVERGGCPPPDTGCQTWTERPRIAPRGLVYTIEAGPNRNTGERITVVNPDGSVRSGWPKTLQRPRATWDSVTIGENRIAYAVAIEPEPNDASSISILAFAPNGTREWIRTIVEP